MAQIIKMKFWSNIFLIIPFYISINYNLYWYSVIIVIVFITSLIFHFYDEHKIIFYFDVVFSSIVMLSNFILLFLGHWILPYSIFAIICALIALIFYFKQNSKSYNIDHSMWHIFSALVCIFCLLTFIN
jgi:hypothetical protein